MDQSKIDAAREKIALGQATMNEGVTELLEATAPVVEPPKPEPVKASTLAALVAAVKAAKAGDMIVLAPGNYGALTFKNVVAPGVTIRAQGAMVTALQINACEGIVIENLAADLAAGGIVKIEASSKIDLLGFSPKNAVLYGVSVLRSQDVRVIGGDFSDVRVGVQGLNSRGLLVRDNRFSRFRADGVNLCGCSDVKIIGNDFTDCIAGPNAHPDGVQLQTNADAEPAENIEIRGNRMWRGASDVKFQGVFIKDETKRLRYRNVVVADNIIEGAMFNGIAVSSTDGFEITGNVVQPYKDMDSRIWLNGVTDGVVTNNTSKVLQSADVSGLKVSGNTTPPAIDAR